MNAATLNTIREVLEEFNDDALDRLNDYDLHAAHRAANELARATDDFYDRIRRALAQRALYPRRAPG